MQTVKLLIKGKVQGVFYRASAKEIAKKLTITGWIKNTKEGNVESVASGSEDAIRQFILWCRQGPPEAIVAEVIVIEKDSQLFKKFSVVK